MQHLTSFFSLIFIVFLGCGDDPSLTPNPSTSCAANTAVIGVHDSYLEILCGCNETARTIVSPPDTLTCTVATGTTVIFQYASVAVIHQIVSTNSAFDPSPLSDPRSNNRIFSHGVLFDQSGTFPFNDQYLPNMQGEIIVL